MIKSLKSASAVFRAFLHFLHEVRRHRSSPAQRRRPLPRLTAARSRRALKGSTSTKAMNGGGSPWDSDDGGWGITWSSDKPVAPDRPFPLCTPCGPGPSQVSSSDFSTQLTGSVGSGGSGWGVTFQHTPVGQSDVATARSRSPRSILQFNTV